MYAPDDLKKVLWRTLTAALIIFPAMMIQPLIRYASGNSTSNSVLLSQWLLTLFGANFLFFGIVDEVCLRWGLKDRVKANEIAEVVHKSDINRSPVNKMLTENLDLATNIREYSHGIFPQPNTTLL